MCHQFKLALYSSTHQSGLHIHSASAGLLGHCLVTALVTTAERALNCGALRHPPM